MGVVLDSTVLIGAERTGKNPRQVIEDIAALLHDEEATISVVTIVSGGGGGGHFGGASRDHTANGQWR